MGVVPDLRRSSVIQDRDAFRAVVAGALASQGMPDFSRWITPREADAIRAYIAVQAAKKIDEATERRNANNAPHQ
jgi:hypothetical protein